MLDITLLPDLAVVSGGFDLSLTPLVVLAVFGYFGCSGGILLVGSHQGLPGAVLLGSLAVGKSLFFLSAAIFV